MSYADFLAVFQLPLSKRSSLNSVFENPSIDANRKVAMFAFYALKHREEMLSS